MTLGLRIILSSKQQVLFVCVCKGQEGKLLT